MKKIILGSLVLSGLLFACDKANVQDSPNGITSNNVTTLKSQGGVELKAARDVHPNGTVDCDNPGFDCDIETAVPFEDYGTIEAVIAASETALPIIFAAKIDDLSSYFPASMISEVINGNIRMEVDGDFSTTETAYFSFYEGAEYIQCHPLSK